MNVTLPTQVPMSQIPLWGWIAIGVIAVVQITLVVVCIVDLSRRTDEQVVGGRRWVWLLVVLFVNAGVGAALYLIAGRRPAQVDEAAPVSPNADNARALDSLYGAPKAGEPR